MLNSDFNGHSITRNAHSLRRVVGASAVIAATLSATGCARAQVSGAPSTGAPLTSSVAQSASTATMAPMNDLPNPYRTIEGWAKMPEGRTWGSTSAVEIDRDGTSIWVAERCGANSCLASPNVDPILKFDANGNLVKSFGAGMLIFPHGIHVDRDGNLWVTDGQSNAPPSGRGGRGGATGAGTGGRAGGAGGAEPPPIPPPPTSPPSGSSTSEMELGVARIAAEEPKGMQVYKFSPDGELLLTLGKPGGAQRSDMTTMVGGAVIPDYFWQPNDVLTLPNGEILVAEGHGGDNARILRFAKDGKYIESWGKKGTGPLEFDQPHALAMDSRGRIFVGDRSNNRIQILDQTGKLLDTWYQFSRPSGIYIDANDVIYVADSESGSVGNGRTRTWKRGIRIGSARTGEVTAFIPDPEPAPPSTSSAEGVAADRNGVIYGAEVGQKALKRYVKNR